MPQFMLTYLGGDQPASKEEGMANMAKYTAWLEELGEAAVSPANPLKSTKIVASDGSINEGSLTKMNGFTLIAANDMEEALSIAKACPFLDVNGSLEVSEVVDMPILRHN